MVVCFSFNCVQNKRKCTGSLQHKVSYKHCVQDVVQAQSVAQSVQDVEEGRAQRKCFHVYFLLEVNIIHVCLQDHRQADFQRQASKKKKKKV